MEMLSNSSTGEAIGKAEKALNTFLGLAEQVTEGSMYVTADKLQQAFGFSYNTNTTNMTPYKDPDSDSTVQISIDNVLDGAWVNFSNQLEQVIHIITRKERITEDEITDLIQEAEEYGYNWIYDNCGKQDIEDDGDYLATRVLDKITDWLNEELHDSYSFEMEEMYDYVVEYVLQHINMDHVLSIVEEIMQAPSTMSEKLRDIGMSESDFI